MAAKMKKYRAKVLIGGLNQSEIDADLTDMKSYLEERGNVGAVQVRLDIERRQAILEAVLQVCYPETATSLLEGEVLRVILPTIRTPDEVYIEPIGAELCDD